MALIVHKVGDSIKWKMKNVQADGVTPVNWTGFTIEVKCVNKITGVVLFTAGTAVIDANKYVTTSSLATGEFEVIVKNTDSFTTGEYAVDIKYTSADGFKQSSKAINLKIVSRL